MICTELAVTAFCTTTTSANTLQLQVFPEAAEDAGVSHWRWESVWQTTLNHSRIKAKSLKKLTEAEIADLFRQMEGQSSDEEETKFVTEQVYCSLNNNKLKLLPYSD